MSPFGGGFNLESKYDKGLSASKKLADSDHEKLRLACQEPFPINPAPLLANNDSGNLKVEDQLQDYVDTFHTAQNPASSIFTENPSIALTTDRQKPLEINTRSD